MALNYRPIRRKELGTTLSAINVTPFVDVMLVLLVIFMVTAPMMQTGIGVNLPKAETRSAPAEEGVIISISKDRYIYVFDSIINEFLLGQRLKEYFMGKEERVVFIRGDEDLSYGYMINVLDIVKQAGVDKIGLIVEPKDRER